MTARPAVAADVRSALNHIAIMVPDVDAGLAWYAKHLGARVLDRWDNPDIGMEWAHLAIGDFVLELVKRPGLDTASGIYGFHHIGIEVDDCDAAVEKMRAAGADIFREPSDFDRHQIRWAFVRDHLGNVLEIQSPLVRKG